MAAASAAWFKKRDPQIKKIPLSKDVRTTSARSGRNERGQKRFETKNNPSKIRTDKNTEPPKKITSRIPLAPEKSGMADRTAMAI